MIKKAGKNGWKNVSNNSKCVRDAISFYLLSNEQLKTKVLEFDASENILRRKSASVFSLIVEGTITYIPGFTVILK